MAVGDCVGADVGSSVVGADVGLAVGVLDGNAVGV